MSGEVGVLSEAESHELPKRIALAGAVRSRPTVATAGALVGLAAIAAALHALLVHWVHGPFVFMDELGYEQMAKSFANTGHFSLFGKGGLAYSPLYPIVLSPLYALTSSMHTAYEWAKVENAVLLSLAVFPIYAIARFVLPRGRSVGVVALSLVAPLMLYSGFEMSESLAYPLFLVAIWMMLRALHRPSVRNDAILLAAIVLASAARLQQVALLPAALTAILLVPLVRSEPPQARRHAVRGAVYRHRLLFGVFAAGLVAVLARTAMNGGNLPLAGRYANVGSAQAGPLRVFELFFQHLAELDWAVGVLPFAAALLAGFALVRFGFPRNALVFASVAVASTFWLLLEVAFDAAAFDPTGPKRNYLGLFDYPRLHERYLIYVMPFFFIALFVASHLRRDRVSSGRHVAAAALATLLTGLIPFGAVMKGPISLESFSLVVFGRTVSGQTVPVAHATTLILALSALLAGVYVLAVTRRLPTGAAVLVTGLALLGLSALELGNQLTPIPRTELGIPAHRDWVDRIVGSNADVSVVGGARTRPVALRETAFWNASIAHVYYTCRPSFGAEFGEQQLVAGSAIRTLYAVVPLSFRVSGLVLARDPAGKLALVTPTDSIVRISAPHCES